MLLQDPEDPAFPKTDLPFPVVGIGASAGGVAALQRLLASLPPTPGMAFVVVMHLSAEHESLLGEILQRSGHLPVCTVTATTPIEVDHVYVISPALRLVMTDGHLDVFPLTPMEGSRSPIDLFFRSLAQAQAERSIGVVLTGTGSDGAQGLRRIKELGGVALAQSPEDAEFDAMPRAAIQTGIVDFVIPIAEMASKLLELWRNARRIELPSPPPSLLVERAQGEAELQAEEALASIKALLRERTGHDFSHYKRGTVLRRLERRMQVNGVADLPAYRQLLDTELPETPALLQDMLISVTNFFRDPEAFGALEQAVRSRVAERHPGEPFRAWVAGCATGEEAYSLCILLREVLGAGATIQLFASDIDERAISAARTGVFPSSIASDVSADRLRNFFVVENNGLRINKATRDMVVFSAHNVLHDPPFTRMDLICCRNLLIYLDRFAQTQVLRSFHFALKQRGLLFLGSSETVDAAEGLFESVNKSHRVYCASPKLPRARSLPLLPSKVPEQLSPTMRAPSKERSKPPLELLHERVLRNYAPPTVLVDAEDTVLHVSERASHLLRLPEGAPTSKLLALARPELRAELRAALTRATETGLIVEAPRVRLTIGGQLHTVIMTVRPATDELPRGLMLVVFDEAQESMVVPAGSIALRDPVVESLEAELLKTQERLKNMVGESTASTEELRASNEELQTINEELRSTSEELETSREELQAVNEELTTVNTELTLRMEDTSKLNDDLQNLMNSAEIGTVFVDREMRVKRFTPQAATIFNLLATDAGRPLLDITHRLDYPDLAVDVRDVLRDLKRIEREVRSDDQRCFLARAVPYRTTDDRIEGAVLAFFDITARRATEEQLRLSERRMRLVAESMRDYAIITMDTAGTIATWSPGAEKIFGYSAADAVGASFELIFTPEDREAGKAREELHKAREAGRADDNRWHLRKDGERVFCSGITSPLDDGRFTGFAKICRNFTAEEMRNRGREEALSAERATSSRLQEVDTMKDEFLAVVSHELKNPLSIIQMNAQLLARLPSFQGDKRALRATDAMKGAVLSQLQLINDLLELSRANMAKLVLSPAMTDMAELVRNIVEAATPDIEAKRQHLTLNIAELNIRADAVRVEQIVWNLVTNAIKFTPEGGGVQIGLAREDDMAVLTVTDDGIGMEAGNLAGVFEMFGQVDAGPSRRGGGLGIGLALVRQLVDLHGGRVAASSAGLGKGSCFTVWLPLAGLPARTLDASPAGGFRGMRILMIDDEVDMLEAFASILRDEGALVTTASNAIEGIERLDAGKFDAVISDIGMPQHDGYWLAEAIRGQADTRNIALVAVSGMAREADIQRAMAAGFDAHLGKPVDLTALESALMDAIGRRMSFAAT
ncbi:chemotaxis protein CheB [Xylophilus sp. GOD-11R]|uniref:chemotaxis protein CheB n=1 Tax=Xylophilus sp. GOD-11R TaxID=3089814 RepID=UPI00298D4C78|nr:chemotaxis protein CheB [Xylophilus sp. GOD-11R]WPB56077.1 chemotaxis protein CheB [Xylophilus sp. GOD-11R]